MPGEERPEAVDELMRRLGVDPGKLAKAGEGALSGAPEPPAASGAEFPPPPSSPSPAPPPVGGLEFLGDVSVRVRIELGRARLSVEDVLRLGAGSVVPLESLTTDPVNVYVNDRLVARGEVLVVNDNFAVRITEVVPPEEPPRGRGG